MEDFLPYRRTTELDLYAVRGVSLLPVFLDQRGRVLRSRIAALCCCLLTVLSGCTSDSSRGSRNTEDKEFRRPNVVVLVTDDQPATGTLSVMPATRELFVEEGRKFPQAFSPTPYCCPSRASIFTGRHTHNHLMYRAADQTPEFDQTTTLQHDLQAAGYRTAIFGKYLNGWDLADDPPYFDDWAIFSKTRATGYRGGQWSVNGKLRKVNAYSTTFLRRKALRFVREASEDDRPWAMFIATAAPHYPITPERKYGDAPVPPRGKRPSSFMERNLSDKPAFVRRLRVKRWNVERIRKAQLRTLMSVDDLVSELYGRLDELSEEQNTLSFFLSDNGFMLGEHSLLGKMVPYEMSIRIPFMMRWPERLDPGTVDRRWATTVDIVPTVLDAIGIGRAAYVDGRSLIDDGWSRDRVMTEFWSIHRRPTWGSLLTERFQYSEYYRRGKVFFREYYDLRDDPEGKRNLLGDSNPDNNPDITDARRRLSRDLECKAGACP